MWEKYQRIGIQEMQPYVPGDDLEGVSVSEKDTPGHGGMIARGSDGSKWYVSKDFFKEHYCSVLECNCVGAKFVEHIKRHLSVGQDVICTICGKTLMEIFHENK